MCVHILLSLTLCFPIFSIYCPLIFLSLCFCGSDSAAESQWGWAKVTSQSTANTTVIACCLPRPTRGMVWQKKQRNERQREEKQRQNRVSRNVSEHGKETKKKGRKKKGGPGAEKAVQMVRPRSAEWERTYGGGWAGADCSGCRESPRSSCDKAAHCSITASRSDRWMALSNVFLPDWSQQGTHGCPYHDTLQNNV